MGKRFFLVSASICLLTAAFCQSKSIKTVQCMNKASEKERFVTLLSDNTIWWSVNGGTWTQIPTTGIPVGSTIKMIDVYSKLSITKLTERLVAVLGDNTVWWYAEGEGWEQIPSKGLPSNAVIKGMKPYVKFSSGLVGSDTRIVVILEDNSLWYSQGREWKSVPAEGLPVNYVVTGFGTYQKYASLGNETRYIITLADNTIWWTAGKKWQKLEASGLPADATVGKFAAYMKVSGRPGINGKVYHEGKLVTVLGDQSIWYFSTGGKEWAKMNTDNLPKGYIVKSMEVYQKYAGMTDEAKIMLLMEDNTIWWSGENTGWTQIDTEDLIK